MSRYHVRCRKCSTRRVLSMLPEHYYRLPKCSHCGAKDFRVDSWMNKRDTKAVSCNCAGYVHLTNRVFPHRKGSLHCWLRKDGTQRMEGDADFKDSRLEEYLAAQHQSTNQGIKMKLTITHAISGRTIFEHEIEDNTTLATVRAALASNADLCGANLCGADLRGANLCGANLRGANLRGANLRGANLCDANLCDANLRDADLCDANLRDADLCGADIGGGKENQLPIFSFTPDPDLPRKVAEAALTPDDALDMSKWHTCQTTHCLAGWAVHLSGAAGYALEAATSPSVAGAMLLPSAKHLFYSDNETAKAWLKAQLKTSVVSAGEKNDE